MTVQELMDLLRNFPAWAPVTVYQLDGVACKIRKLQEEKDTYDRVYIGVDLERLNNRQDQ